MNTQANIEAHRRPGERLSEAAMRMADAMAGSDLPEAEKTPTVSELAKPKKPIGKGGRKKAASPKATEPNKERQPKGLRAAIIKVLGDAKEPMTSKEIWDEINRRRLQKTSGKTPWATVAATCYTHDEFKVVGKGKFALKK